MGSVMVEGIIDANRNEDDFHLILLGIILNFNQYYVRTDQMLIPSSSPYLLL